MIRLFLLEYASSPDPDHQLGSVRAVLAEIGAAEVDELVAFNKIDAADQTAVDRLRALHPDAVFISAQNGDGISELLDAVVDGLNAKTVELELHVPYARGDVLAELHQIGDVVALNHTPDGTEITVKMPHDDASRFRKFVNTSSPSPLQGGQANEVNEGGLRAREPGVGGETP